jgi:hypothetical protein
VAADPGAPVRVSVATDPALPPRGQLGVLAAAGDAQTVKQFGPPAAASWLADAIAARGRAAAASPPLTAGPGSSTLVWEVPN